MSLFSPFRDFSRAFVDALDDMPALIDEPLPPVPKKEFPQLPVTPTATMTGASSRDISGPRDLCPSQLPPMAGFSSFPSEPVSLRFNEDTDFNFSLDPVAELNALLSEDDTSSDSDSDHSRAFSPSHLVSSNGDELYYDAVNRAARLMDRAVERPMKKTPDDSNHKSTLTAPLSEAFVSHSHTFVECSDRFYATVPLLTVSNAVRGASSVAPLRFVSALDLRRPCDKCSEFDDTDKMLPCSTCHAAFFHPYCVPHSSRGIRCAECVHPTAATPKTSSAKETEQAAASRLFAKPPRVLLPPLSQSRSRSPSPVVAANHSLKFASTTSKQLPLPHAFTVESLPPPLVFNDSDSSDCESAVGSPTGPRALIKTELPLLKQVKSNSSVSSLPLPPPLPLPLSLSSAATASSSPSCLPPLPLSSASLPVPVSSAKVVAVKATIVGLQSELKPVHEATAAARGEVTSVGSVEVGPGVGSVGSVGSRVLPSSCVVSAAFLSCDNGDSDDPNGELSVHKLHSCDYCGKTFTRKGHLVCHLRVHTGSRPFKCDRCDQRFSQKSHFNRHMKIHNGVKAHKCPHAGCDRAFVQRCNLRAHMQTHNFGGVPRPFVCGVDGCTKAFSRKAARTRHVLALHGVITGTVVEL